jgi:hypothetical protein
MKIMKTQKFMKFTNEQKQLVCNLIYIEQLQSWKNAELNYNDFIYDIAVECIRAGIDLDYFKSYIYNYIIYLKEKENIVSNVENIYEINKDNFATKFDYYYKIVTKAQEILKKL